MKKCLMLVLLLGAVVTLRAEGPPDDDPPPPRPPPEHNGFAPPHPPPDGPPPVQQWMERWKEKRPEEYDRLQRLREEDPEAFRAELHRRLQEARREKGPGRKGGDFGPHGGPGGDFDPGSPQLKAAENKVRELAHAWRSAGSAEDQARLKAELEAALGQAFDQREQLRRERLAEMEKKLAELRSGLEQRSGQRAAIIEKRLREITSDGPQNTRAD